MNTKIENRILEYCKLAESYIPSNEKRALGYLEKASRIYSWYTRKTRENNQKLDDKIEGLIEKLCNKLMNDEK